MAFNPQHETPHSHGHHGHEDMLEVEQALSLILQHFSILNRETKPILEAIGQTLAEDIIAPFNIPPMPNSAMDGYAVRSVDIKGATNSNPKYLKVIGQVAAGKLPTQMLTEGTAVRIMTGAPTPNGTDVIIPFEDTDELERSVSAANSNFIGVKFELIKGSNVRPMGGDITQGETVLKQGLVLGPTEIGVLASVGQANVNVIRRPVVSILATGDEILTPGQPIEPGKIFDSNSFSLSAAVMKYGGTPHQLGIAADNIITTKNKVMEGLDGDFLITSAGVSKGDYDLVKDVLKELGEIEFWSVRMRPGKPLAFGRLHAKNGNWIPIVGLPGNPVSALVAFEQFCRPAILKMLGRSKFVKPTIDATIQHPIFNTDGRRVYARVLVTREQDGYHAHLTGSQESNVLTSLLKANGLAICPANVRQLDAGQIVRVQMLDWPEEM
ncbi:molybdopterin molybdotransferase MoeA [SAR202 cluster bacterium AD-802-E10_MRT_200m]|nr:molybdopterin molybdotransferase MoeA [SAR202 cluster bacterium AD-802-E10_MRT_200m]